MKPTHDIVVIGGGSAGLTGARFAARLGARVALIERHRLGGDCTWTGCVPSKALLRAAKAAHGVRKAEKFGIDVPAPTVDMARVRAHVMRAVGAVYEGERPEVLREEGIDVALPLARQANALEPIPWFMGEFLMLAGEAKEAIPYLRYSWDSPWAWYLLGQAYEQEGEPSSALDAYEVFIAAWADADPELQPYVQDARGRLVALIDELD